MATTPAPAPGSYFQSTTGATVTIEADGSGTYRYASGRVEPLKGTEPLWGYLVGVPHSGGWRRV